MIIGSDIVIKAEEYLGIPYKWGGNGPDGWDCSGFVLYVLRKCGIEVGDMSSGAIYDWCKKDGSIIPLNDARRKAGCLVFRRGDNGIEHIGISDGANNTVEARGAKYGTGKWPWRENWTDAALVPGVFYAKGDTI